MGDVSEFFKMHLNLFNKASVMGQKSNANRKEFELLRKCKRDTLMKFRRNIPENPSPYVTPVSNKINETQLQRNNQQFNANNNNSNSSVPAKKIVPNKRLELLAKWKAEKEERKRVERAKAKPIFKICHVSREALPDVSNANKVIKGKPIVTLSKKEHHQFAPPNHKFKPPSGIKPFEFTLSPAKSQKDFCLISKAINTLAEGKKILKNQIIKNIETSSALVVPSTHKQNKLNSHIPEKNKLYTNDTSASTRITRNKSKNLKKNFNTKVDSSIVSSTPIVKSKSNKELCSETGGQKKNSSHQALKNVSQLETTDSTFSSTPIVKSKLDKELFSKTGRQKKNSSHQAPSNVSQLDTTDSTVSSTHIVKSKLNKESCSKTGRQKENSSNQSLKNASQLERTDSTVSGTHIVKSKLNKESYSKTGRLKKNSSNQSLRNTSQIEKTDSSVSRSPIVKSKLYEESCRKTARQKNNCSNESLRNSSHQETTQFGNKLNGVSSLPSPPVVVNLSPPVNKLVDVPVYVSPYVTLSRGKRSARKEYKVRNSLEININDNEILKNISSCTNPQSGANYFTNKLDMEIEKILSICNKWETYLKGPEVPEEARSSIDVAIGQSKLLISKKFQQFRGLIDQCRSPNVDEKAITCSDLHGFWDMIYMQVEDVEKRFNNLDRLKDNNWEEMLPEIKVPEKKCRGRPKKVSATSKLKNLIEAARKQKKNENESDIVEGSNNVHIATRDQILVNGSAKKNLRNSLLTSQSRLSCSSSPGLTMMKISQSIKQGQGVTPVKGILKAEVNNSTGKKSVIFKEDLLIKKLSKISLFNNENKENSPENVKCPLTPRRSARLSKLN
ncbi:uncharacterized protein LOC115887844 [Sitophilus oryzae]|uniref:Uncharacterized protein LOC115887844 n=1 Tax=Sitophilus oryzae TaxID=7048 RepID=A0A6J2YK19_SITOR|nr:uncharacterized protein LOC115887844 [Sitophilus oryzae]